MSSIVNLAVGILLVELAFTAGASFYFSQQQTLEVNRANTDQKASLQTQASDLQNQIDRPNKQIDSPTQLWLLETMNGQLVSNNSQLIGHAQDLHTQIRRFEDQRDQLQPQLSSLRQIVGIHASRMITSEACTFPDCRANRGTGNQIGDMEFISIGALPYAGYLRVSWSGAHVSVSVRVYDANVITPVQASGIYNVPVAENATSTAHFAGSDCQPVPAGLFCTPIIFSISYWY